MRGTTKLALVGLSLLSAVAVGFGISTSAAHIDYSRDCDKYAVVRCGTKSVSELRAEYASRGTYSNGSKYDSTRKQADIPAIFSALGISQSDLNGSFHSGVVYKNGIVKVKGKTVAKNAVMGARHLGGKSIRGSSTGKLVSVSKMSSAQGAFVKLNKYGQFMFAVMVPCGNPVSAKNTVPTPKPKPVYECKAITKSQLSRDTFKFDTKTMVGGSAKNKSYTYNFGDGTSKTVASGPVTHKYAKPSKYNVQVIPTFMVNGKLVKKTSAACVTTIEVKSAPSAVCKDLSAEFVNRTTRKFVTKAEAKDGAKINGYAYDFGDSKTAFNGASISHTYDKPGDYTAKVTVKTSVGDRTGKQCQVPVTIAKPKTPSVKIEKTVNGVEHAKVNVGEDYTYELVVTNNGEVNLTNVKVSDPAPKHVKFVKASVGSVSGNVFTHTIPSLKTGESKKFTITAKTTEYFDGDLVNNACVDAPQIPGDKDDCDDASTETGEKKEVCDKESKKIIKIDRSLFEKDNGERYTEDYDLCKPTPAPTTPPELPKTGATEVLSGAAGLVAVVVASYYYLTSRRTA